MLCSRKIFLTAPASDHTMLVLDSEIGPLFLKKSLEWMEQAFNVYEERIERITMNKCCIAEKIFLLL